MFKLWPEDLVKKKKKKCIRTKKKVFKTPQHLLTYKISTQFKLKDLRAITFFFFFIA